jgi:hypothetical protein
MRARRSVIPMAVSAWQLMAARKRNAASGETVRAGSDA